MKVYDECDEFTVLPRKVYEEMKKKRNSPPGMVIISTWNNRPNRFKKVWLNGQRRKVTK